MIHLDAAQIVIQIVTVLLVAFGLWAWWMTQKIRKK